ncbi:MAG: DUF2029 domain-containing protein, partial [Gemmatimonadetes bacterium]|nr:DUF2029 domain-containing protein [Gemmatimonadota bacterium]
WAAVVLVLSQAGSLVYRAHAGTSDVSVFIRTAEVVREGGAGPGLYAQPDALSGWARTIPPAGLWPFVVAGPLGATGVGVAWALVNLVLVAVGACAALSLLSRAGRTPSRTTGLWVVALWMVLASASLQVGQFSILFATCWLVGGAAVATGRHVAAGLAFAWPTLIKLYPAFLLPGLFASLTWRRTLLGLAVGGLTWAMVLPLWAIGAESTALLGGFLQHVVFSPDGRVATYFSGAISVTNQGLEPFLARYLTHSPDFHGRYRVLHVDAPALLGPVALLTRGTIVSATAWTAYQARRLPVLQGAPAQVALWASALYAMLPETKARYAVYVFPAFLWWIIVWTRVPLRAGTRVGRGVVVSGFALVLLGALPRGLLAWGVGYPVSVAVWLITLGLTFRALRRSWWAEDRW